MLITLTILLYAGAVAWQGSSLIGKKPSLWGLWAFGVSAIVLHGFLLYRWIDVGGGQNLYFFNVLSLVAWVSAGLVLVSSLRKPVQNLLIFIFPLALLSILLVNEFPGSYLINTGQRPLQLVHVILSTLAFSILCVAAFQALLLLVQDWLLRLKRAGAILHLLPPIETMESLLFEIIGLGFVFLSVVLFLSLLTYPFMEGETLSHSPYLAILAWIVFAILLWGHYRLGWRGRTAIRWTVSGVVILAISYFGHWLIAGFLY